MGFLDASRSCRRAKEQVGLIQAFGNICTGMKMKSQVISQITLILACTKVKGLIPLYSTFSFEDESYLTKI